MWHRGSSKFLLKVLKQKIFKHSPGRKVFFILCVGCENLKLHPVAGADTEMRQIAKLAHLYFERLLNENMEV